MDTRLTYAIVIADKGDRVQWNLFCDGENVAGGNVLLFDIDLDDAFAHAFSNANTTRLAREA